MLPEFDCSFDALRLRKDLVARFGGDEEDRNYKIHSLACTMAPGNKAVKDYENTWSSFVVGGMEVVSEIVDRICNSIEDIDTDLRMDEANTDMTQHSTCLFCDHCMKHSVVSYESYVRTVSRMCDTVDGQLRWQDTTAVQQPFQSGVEYYMHIALTWGLLKTPLFARMNDVVEMRSSKLVAMNSILIPEEQAKRERKMRDTGIVMSSIGGGVDFVLGGYALDDEHKGSNMRYREMIAMMDSVEYRVPSITNYGISMRPKEEEKCREVATKKEMGGEDDGPRRMDWMSRFQGEEEVVIRIKKEVY